MGFRPEGRQRSALGISLSLLLFSLLSIVTKPCLGCCLTTRATLLLRSRD